MIVAIEGRWVGEAQAAVDSVDAQRLRCARRAAHGHQHGAPFDHLKFELDAERLERLLDQLVHRQRQHLPRACGRDHDLGLGRIFRPVAGLRQQRLRLLGIVGVLVLRIAEERAIRRIEAGRRLRRSVQELDDALAVHRVVDGLPHALVAERRLLAFGIERIRPRMRIRPKADLKARLAKTGNGIRRRHLDPVDLA